MIRRIIEGTIQGNERGYGFLIPKDQGLGDYFVSHSDLRGALHGDTVLAEATERKNEKTTARVLKILERSNLKITGTYFSTRKGGFVTPDDRRYFVDIFIPFGRGLSAKSGDKVACKILSYPHKMSPEGIITRIFGRQFNMKAELSSLYYSYNLPEEFPKKVEKEIEKVSDIISKKDYEDREDLTNLTTVTIDGEDARDFDDAISIEKLEKGYRLGVHIADVTHYVTEGSQTDKEAFNRGTSVYFPERVVPMLPEKLSNGVCSLQEGKNRLTLSCLITIGENGVVKKFSVFPAVIKSRARLTYTEVQKMIEGDVDIINNKKFIAKDVLLMAELAKILTKKREKRGCIDLDVKESSIRVLENGQITIEPTEQSDARKLIEEFMVLANVCVATTMTKIGLPFVYRIHEKPEEEKRKTLFEFLKGLGVNVDEDREITTRLYQQILKNSAKTPAFTVINRVMLRSMQKAKYSTENLGHFGLGEECYCHFTSPIRRYPDLAIHRIIKDYLKNGKRGFDEKYQEFTKNASVQSSITERNAIEAERAVDDFYKMFYISNFIGKEFEGVISGVTARGIFVELYNGVEGFIRVDSLGKRYVFDERRYSLTCGKTSYKLGQTVKIRVEEVEYSSKKINFSLCV